MLGMINAKEILKKARDGRYAIGQFNVSNLETVKAILGAAQNFNSPVIIGTSEGEREFIGRRQIVKLIEAYQEELQIPIILNADHTKSFEEIKKVVDAGYSAVHFDGSELSFEENIKITKEVMEYAKSRSENILVEGELGYLRGGSTVHEAVEIKEEDMTKPDEAAEFVKETGIDSLAVVIGNVHGIVKGGNPKLDLEHLKKIKEATGHAYRQAGETFLVLHGGSGIDEKDIREAIKIGIVKVNINTELRVAYVGTLRNFLSVKPEETTPYKIFPDVISAIQKITEDKIKLFGGEKI